MHGGDASFGFLRACMLLGWKGHGEFEGCDNRGYGFEWIIVTAIDDSQQ